MTNTRKGNNNESAGDAGTGSMSHSPEFFRDARGNTYQAVRFCDLDRLCDK